MTTAVFPARHWLMPLNAVLAVVCAVLFLLAIEQRQALDAWRTGRSTAVSMVERTGVWIESGAAMATRQAAGRPAPTAPDAVDMVLSGPFVSEDPPGAVVFQHQDIRFEAGPTLHTRPLRIAAAGEVRVDGQTLAERLNTVAEAQIEWRRVEAAADETEAAARLCGGAAPQHLAILHRGETVDLLLFPADAPALDDMAAPCGQWRLRAQ